MKKLAIFDVDYTLTKKETLFEFYKFMVKKNPKMIIKLPKILVAGILFFIKVLDAGTAKEMFISFIDGVKEEDMKKQVKEFYDVRLSKILYVDAINTMKKLKSEGYEVVLISASAEFYLNELYNIKEVDRIIGTRFTNENGIFNRKIVGENCKGEEKVRRLKEVLNKEKIEVDFKNSYMFSDSLSDMPLFKLVGHPYLVNPRKKDNNIKALKWK
ncbi:HAD-IB family hydrolase [Clostridium felsineum]|uniref:Phosphatase n=1 Tax=Clostridium felsineum TaxID=36839 RepID=A0A1S8L8V5_9CLOT|nr:HAD-IB family hydrolase [Clostridium felsineum]MCR3757753.1 HAD-IB family hydrolase [Clostridium felsineum]URZ00999.1 putative phosphatase [Clostridium felsineum]URZ06251.1 putative phosphatase [Clostridium felsineum]URZ11286.1 putative phosphatase [Clostridium felsineum]